MLSERCQTKNEYIIHDSIHISFRKCKGTYSDRNKISAGQRAEWKELQGTRGYLGGERQVHYLDFGDGFTGEHNVKTHQLAHFKCAVNCILILPQWSFFSFLRIERREK